MTGRVWRQYMTVSAANPAATTSRPAITSVSLKPVESPPPELGFLNPGSASVLRTVVVVELDVVDEEVELLEDVLEAFGRTVVDEDVPSAVVVGAEVVVGASVELVDDDEDDEDEEDVVDSVVVVVSSACADGPSPNRSPATVSIDAIASETRDRRRRAFRIRDCAGSNTPRTIVAADLSADGGDMSRSCDRRWCDAVAKLHRPDTLRLGFGPPGDHPDAILPALRVHEGSDGSPGAEPSLRPHRASGPLGPGRTLTATALHR